MEPIDDPARVGVTDNEHELRYELDLDGRVVGELRYRREPGAVALVHIDIEPRCEGRGLGSRLVEGALDDVRARGLAVVPHAPFVVDFIRRRPEYASLVTVDPAVPE